MPLSLVQERLICITLYLVKWIYYAASLNRLTSCNLIPVVYGFQQNMITSFIKPKNKQKNNLGAQPVLLLESSVLNGAINHKV